VTLKQETSKQFFRTVKNNRRVREVSQAGGKSLWC